MSAPAWMPIDSAPKDGTPVIVGAAGFRPVYVRWHDEAWRYPFSTRKLTVYPPTHWMPLPARLKDKPIDVGPLFDGAAA